LKPVKVRGIPAIVFVAALLAAGGAIRPASAQSTFGDRWQSTPAQASQPKPGTREPAAQQPKLPVSLEQALYLIRSTLLTLNDANRSGNYTVLRELAAPNFQSKNSAADLGTIFSDLRARKIDLFPVALLAPQLSTPPNIVGNGMLRLTGTFPTQPLQISFDLMFENVAGQWRLFGISVQTPQAQTASPIAGSQDQKR
jgi:hypothetical protein